MSGEGTQGTVMAGGFGVAAGEGDEVVRSNEVAVRPAERHLPSQPFR